MSAARQARVLLPPLPHPDLASGRIPDLLGLTVSSILCFYPSFIFRDMDSHYHYYLCWINQSSIESRSSPQNIHRLSSIAVNATRPRHINRLRFAIEMPINSTCANGPLMASTLVTTDWHSKCVGVTKIVPASQLPGILGSGEATYGCEYWEAGVRQRSVVRAVVDDGQ